MFSAIPVFKHIRVQITDSVSSEIFVKGSSGISV